MGFRTGIPIVLVRSCSDIGRHRRRWRAPIAILPREPAESDGSTRRADRDQIERGLLRLTDAQRAILVLNFYVGLSPTETAAALEIPVGTAKSRLHYAIEALRAAIAADERIPVGAARTWKAPTPERSTRSRRSTHAQRV